MKTVKMNREVRRRRQCLSQIKMDMDWIFCTIYINYIVHIKGVIHKICDAEGVGGGGGCVSKRVT
jgi:hypothetical protein